MRSDLPFPDDPMRSFLFITDEAYLREDRQGGVQVCTHEYLELLKATGAPVAILTARPDRRITRKVLRRFQGDYFDRYRFSDLLPEFDRVARECSATHVFLNQVSLLGLLPVLREAYPGRFKYVLLSHGNESGDFLHQVARSEDPNPFKRLIDRLRLGSMLCHESHAFSRNADLVLSLSETDYQINRWLGAQDGMVVPRTFRPEEIGWSPILGRVGFVGTLDHLPNYAGLIEVLDALVKQEASGIRVRLVGGPASIGMRIAATYPMVDYLGTLDDEGLKQESASWALFLHPIFWFARGASTKLASPINWGIPVITTTAGMRGYQWTRGSLIVREKPIHFAETIAEFAQDLGGLQSASQDVREVARSGPDLVELARRLNTML
ncbi:MAG: glycosyltransferase [Holophagaceae bacterium]